MEMGKEIRRLRMDRGLTQEALADALNVTAQTVSKWECGNSIPDVQLLPEIAIFFGVTIDQLFAMTAEQQMDRIENRICTRGMFDEAEERQIAQTLTEMAEKPDLSGRAFLLLTELYNNQAEQYRLLAGRSLGQLYPRLERAQPPRADRLVRRLCVRASGEPARHHVAAGQPDRRRAARRSQALAG